MSYEADDCYSVYRETKRCARKPHECSACKGTINARVEYWYIVAIFDNKVSCYKRCLRCQYIHVYLRHLCRTEPNEPMWPDERLNCGNEFKEEWGRDPPEHIAALAFLSASDPLPIEVP